MLSSLELGSLCAVDTPSTVSDTPKEPLLKVAVIGLGYWGPQLVRNLQAAEGCTSLLVCDKDPSKVKAILRQYSAAEGTTRADDVFDDDSVSAVILATPVQTHHDLAFACLESGKSCLVEKPLATSGQQARQLVEIARDKRLLVMAAHTFLYSPAVQLVRNVVANGEIGDPLYAQSSRVNLGIHQSDVSVIWDLAPHDLSILTLWLDETPNAVSAVGRSTHGIAPVDVAFVDVSFPSGCIANLHLSWLAPTKLRRTTLVGTKRMLIYEDTNSEEPVRVFDKGVDIADPEDFGQFKATYRMGDITAPAVGNWEPLRAEVDHFLARVAAGETPDKQEESAVEIVRTIEASERSLNEKGAFIEL